MYNVDTYLYINLHFIYYMDLNLGFFRITIYLHDIQLLHYSITLKYIYNSNDHAP